MSTIDLSNPPPGHSYDVRVEREERGGDRFVRLFKDLVVFLMAVAFVGVIAWICLDTLRSTSAAAEEKKWAMSILSAATGGIVGYLLKR